MRVCYWTMSVQAGDKQEFERIIYRGAPAWATLDKISESSQYVTYETVREDDDAEVGMDFRLYVKRLEEAGKKGLVFVGMFSEHTGSMGTEIYAQEVISTGEGILSINCPDNHAPGIIFSEEELHLVSGVPTLRPEAVERYRTFFTQRNAILKKLGLPDLGWHMPLLFQETL
jgi:hypothetical protein